LRVLCFSAWPLLVERQPRGLRWRLGSAHGLWGFVSAVPTEAAGLLPRQALFVLAGPLASLLGGLCCLFVAFGLTQSADSLLDKSQLAFRH
jgi:hypothetical protein